MTQRSTGAAPRRVRAWLIIAGIVAICGIGILAATVLPEITVLNPSQGENRNVTPSPDDDAQSPTPSQNPQVIPTLSAPVASHTPTEEAAEEPEQTDLPVPETEHESGGSEISTPPPPEPPVIEYFTGVSPDGYDDDSIYCTSEWEPVPKVLEWRSNVLNSSASIVYGSLQAAPFDSLPLVQGGLPGNGSYEIMMSCAGSYQDFTLRIFGDGGTFSTATVRVLTTFG